MNFRIDFVTNSSSSSFIIAYKNTDSNNNILKKLFKSNYDDTEHGFILMSKSAFDEYILNQFNIFGETNLDEIFENDETVKEFYDNALNYLSNNYQLFIKRVDFCDEKMSEIIKELTDNNDDFILLYVDC